MAYTATIINILNQFGQWDAEVIVADDAGVLPSYRVPVSYKSEQIDASFLEQIKVDAIARATTVGSQTELTYQEVVEAVGG